MRKYIFIGIGCNNIAQQGLHLYLMDDVTAYLYGSLENHIYMKIPEGFNFPNKGNSTD